MIDEPSSYLDVKQRLKAAQVGEGAGQQKGTMSRMYLNMHTLAATTSAVQQPAAYHQCVAWPDMLPGAYADAALDAVITGCAYVITDCA